MEVVQERPAVAPERHPCQRVYRMQLAEGGWGCGEPVSAWHQRTDAVSYIVGTAIGGQGSALPLRPGDELHFNGVNLKLVVNHVHAGIAPETDDGTVTFRLVAKE